MPSHVATPTRTGRAVVTGGAGFLGSHLCEALLDHGFEVVCLDNFSTAPPSNIAHLSDRPAFSFGHCDVSQPFEVDGPVDVVLHFASPASPVDYLQMPVQTMRVGSAGTLHCLELARARGARFVLASTSEVYGDPLQHPQREDYWGNVNPVGPRGVYDEAKRYAEALTTAFRTTYRLDTAIVRIFNTYGPRMRPNDGRAIPTFIRQSLAGEAITVAGDGSQTRSICYVEDTIRGIVGMAGGMHPGPINIGNPDEVSVLELAERVREVTGAEVPIQFVDLPEDDPKQRRPDTTLARQVLGWDPQVDSAEGLRRTVAWFASTLSAA